MALPVSPDQLSLSQIAGEFGGAQPHKLSEYYGVASGIPTSGQIKISEFYGKSSSLLSSTVTVEYYQVAYAGDGYGFVTSGSQYYDSEGGTKGSISPSSASGLLSGASIVHAAWFNPTSGSDAIHLEFAGNHTNAGFTTFTVGSTSYSRTSASYNYSSLTNSTLWSWTAASNPFGTSGTVSVVIS